MFYHNWKEQIDLMTEAELRNFINNLIRYDKGEEVILNTKEEKLCWLGIRLGLEINKNKYENICIRNRTNAQKAGAPIGNKNASRENNRKQLNLEKSSSDISGKEKTIQNNPNQSKQSDNREQIIDNRELETESDHRNGVEEDSAHTILENTGPEEKKVDVNLKTLSQIVPHSSFHSDGVRNNEEDPQEDLQDELMNDETYKELEKLLNEQLKHSYPNWKKKLMNLPLNEFLVDTAHFHNNEKLWIDMFSSIKSKLQPVYYTI